ncbi:hypothetical protein AK812_SmicGene39255 [Symbiodinium microadriaticum]|uniref:CSC1/OSCA1-like 7TM region domain-containing protein n=1 Tax=Symbiodinium microadriaticum TaxID=2951 RepID=A0A1Q9CBZ1_SYMMI|nr:hypothetical protein AK812_SmicGene39255 [Symbiodinium microadriaticum]
MLVITIICQIACSVALPVLWVLTVDPLIRWFFCKDTHSQELLNEYHVLPEWTLSLRVAETLVVVFCVLMYSSGFPVLYIFGAIYCACAFWADKYALLRGSRKPPGYTKSAIESAVIMCPFAVLFHLLFTIWLFGNQDSSLTLELRSVARSTPIKASYHTRNTRIYYATVILRALFAPCIGNRLNQLGEAGLKGLGIIRDAEQETVTLTDARERGDIKNLLSYRMSENPNYEEAVLALKFDPDAGDKEAKDARKSQKGVSFTSMEEGLERAMEKQVHAAENLFSSAIQGCAYFETEASDLTTGVNDR